MARIKNIRLIYLINKDGEKREEMLKADEFNRKYEESIEDLSYAELDLVVQLNKTQLKEFVYSPSKIRLRLLKKLSEERSIVDSTVDSVKNVSLGLTSMLIMLLRKLERIQI